MWPPAVKPLRMTRRVTIAALLVAGLVVVADQSSKYWALTTLRSLGGHLALSGPVDITFNWNQSNAFGLTPVVGGATRWFLMSVNLVAAALLLHAVVTRALTPVTRFGLSLIMAGAVGNALDRLIHGAVVDFFDATKLGFPWIFNLADATVDVGIALVILSAALSEYRTTDNERT
jgi:signal peptidase II